MVDKTDLSEYYRGRSEAAEDVRNACLLLGGDAIVNMHLLVSAAQGKS